MRALVTGGAGFIGSHIVELLLSRDWKVTVLDNLDERVHAIDSHGPANGAELMKGDVRDRGDVERALSGRPDAVFHEAAMVGLGRGEEDSAKFADVNVHGTEVLLDRVVAVCPSARIILGSSMAIYGEGEYDCQRCATARRGGRSNEDLESGFWDPKCSDCGTALSPRPIPEDREARPETAYSRSKLEQERSAFRLGRELGVAVVALRYHNVYGAKMPRDTPYAGVASFFRSRLAAGLPPLVHEDGHQLRDFIRVEDVARANLMAAEAPRSAVDQESFNVATGAPRSIMDLAKALAMAIAPGSMPVLSGAYRAGDPRHVFASPEKAANAIGFRSVIGFDEGVLRFAGEPLRAPPRRIMTC